MNDDDDDEEEEEEEEEKEEEEQEEEQKQKQEEEQQQKQQQEAGVEEEAEAEVEMLPNHSMLSTYFKTLSDCLNKLGEYDRLSVATALQKDSSSPRLRYMSIISETSCCGLK